MTSLLTLKFFKNGKFVGSVDWDKSDEIVLGRQRSADEARFQCQDADGQCRIAFANFQDGRYSRQQLRLARIAEGKLRITSASNSVLPVLISPNTTLASEQSVERVFPTEISVGDYRIRIERPLHSLARQTKFQKTFEPVLPGSMPLIVTGGPNQSAMVGPLIEELSLTNSILQQATSRDELYSKAITAVKRLIDMDGVAVVNAADFSDVFSLEPISPVDSAMAEVLETRRVCWTSFDQETITNELQLHMRMNLDCFIGAPIMMPGSEQDKVAAIFYAHRNAKSEVSDTEKRQPLSELHAQIFELVACSVAAGLVRMDHQATQGRFQQFFTPALAQELMKSDAILEPSEREITVLFCDIRRFSSISEKLGPRQTSQWVHDVMSSLSDCVLQFDGVLVDYVGDEVMAMWGAPTDQPDHAIRACHCAKKIMETVPAINDKWRDVISDETRVGVGINTGLATVGNTGSKYKFKYGPLGDTVNRASRVQGLTKYLRVDVILTGDTKRQLNDEFKTRRLGKAKVVNIDRSLELFELCAGNTGNANPLYDCYENALRDLERGSLGTAAKLLQSLDFDAPDHPALLIMNEIINRVINDRPSGDFEWEFLRK